MSDDSWYVAKTQDDGVIARLQSENKALSERVCVLEKESSQLVLILEDTQRMNARLREALEWYADKANYNPEGAPCHDRPDDTNGGFPTDLDVGSRARAALSRQTPVDLGRSPDRVLDDGTVIAGERIIDVHRIPIARTEKENSNG